MQDVPLTVDIALRRAETVGRDVGITSIDGRGERRTTWGEIADRSRLLMRALENLGVPRSGRVGTFGWNSSRHLELYLAVPASGRVLHAINVRLDAEAVRYVISHAEDRVIFVDASLTAALAVIDPKVQELARIIVMDDGGEVAPEFAECQTYEELLAEAGLADTYSDHAPALDENEAAAICFTSGTTGRPKAVVYSHRSIILHSLGSMGVDSHGLSRRDTLLPLTPMFHVNCWGLPYTAAMASARIVFAGRDVTPEQTAVLVEREKVTIAAGVPTLWVRFVGELESGTHDLSSLKRVLSGGAEAQPALIEQYTSRGITYFQGWGATEMSPSGTAAVVRPGHDDATWGPAVPLVELRLRADDGSLAPWDGVTQGELEARGPWVASAYLPARG